MGAFSLIVGGIYICNQLFDIESDRKNNKLFILPQKLVSIPVAWVLAVVPSAVAIVWAFSYHVVVGALFTLSSLLGVGYNLWFKNRPYASIVANGLGHGALCFAAGWCAVEPYLTSSLASLAILLPATLANAAVFALTTVVDIQGDLTQNKRTPAVAFGVQKTIVIAAILCILATATTFLLPANRWVFGLAALCSCPFFIVLLFSRRRENVFKAFKWPVFLLSATVSLFLPLYAVLLAVIFFFSRWYYAARFNYNYPSFGSQ